MESKRSGQLGEPLLTAELQFLPVPSSVVRSGKSFRLESSTPIVLGPQPGDELQRIARGLQTAVRGLLGFELPLATSTGGRPAIELAVLTDGKLGRDAYELTVGPAGVRIAGGAAPGLYYGVQTLIQLARCTGGVWPGVAIADAPELAVRGLMVDISRGKVPTLATLIRLVETLANYKYNHLQLYTEHTFHFPSHPEIGRDAGSLTADDILVLDRVCRDHFIELVPNLQSIGHQHAILNLPQYQHLAETRWNWTFSTVEEGSFRLLDDLYGDMLPAFSSPWFNVNADEPWDLGRGRSAARAAEVGIGGVYHDHVRRLHDLVTRGHHRRMMMWADMFWFHPELAGELPDDIVFLDWWYEEKETFDSVQVLANANRTFLVCPGTSAWGSFFPRLDNATANILGFVRAGVAAGAQGMLMTDWGDGGHYPPHSNSWYPFLWAAECAWTGGTTTRDAFDLAFDRLFLADGSGRVTAALRRLGETTQIDPTWLTTWNTAMAVFEEPIDGALARITPEHAVASTATAAAALEPLLDTVRDDAVRHDLALVTAFLQFGAAKVETSRALQQALAADEPDRAELERLVTEMRDHRDRLPALIERWRENWLTAARPSEMRITLERFDRLVAQYDKGIGWLAEQCRLLAAGEPLTSYDRGGYAVLWEETRDRVKRLIEIIGFDALPKDLQEWMAAVRESSTAQ